MEKKIVKYSEVAVVSNIRKKIEKINRKFPSLVLCRSHTFVLPGQAPDTRVQLFEYSLNLKFPNWHKVLLSNPVLHKNLRLGMVYGPEETGEAALLGSLPALFEYPSTLWTEESGLRSYQLGDIDSSIERHIPFSVSVCPLADGKLLYVTFSTYCNAWILLYADRHLALITRKGAIVHPKETTKDKATHSPGLLSATKMWNQTLAQWKMQKVLAEAEQMLTGHTLVLECTGDKHKPAIFALKDDNEDGYTALAMLHNTLPKAGEALWGTKKFREFLLKLKLKGKTVESLVPQWTSMETFLQTLLLHAVKEHDRRRSQLAIIEGEGKVVGMLAVISPQYKLHIASKDMLCSYVTHKTTAAKPLILSDDYIKKTLQDCVDDMANTAKLSSEEIVSRQQLEAQVQTIRLGIDLLETQPPGNVEMFKRQFPSFLRQIAEWGAKKKIDTTAELQAASKEKPVAGQHVVLLAPKSCITSTFISEVNTKYRFESWSTISLLEQQGGSKGSVCYVEELPLPEVLLAYLKTHICRLVVYGFDNDNPEVQQLRLRCLNPGVTFVDIGSPTAKTNAGLYELVHMGMKLLRSVPTVAGTKAATAVRGAPTQAQPQAPPAEDSKAKPAKEASGGQKDVLVLAFLGLPGIGKSYIIKSLVESQVARQGKYVLSVVSSDEIKQRCMQTYLQQHAQETHDAAFQKTLKIAKQTYSEELR